MKCWASSSLCFAALEYRWVCLLLNKSYRLSSTCLPGNHTHEIHMRSLFRFLWEVVELATQQGTFCYLFFTCHKLVFMLLSKGTVVWLLNDVLLSAENSWLKASSMKVALAAGWWRSSWRSCRWWCRNLARCSSPFSPASLPCAWSRCIPSSPR